MYYDTNINKRQTKKHLVRRGLDSPEISLADIGIIDLVKDPGIDTQLYNATDTGDVDIQDGVAHAVYTTARKVSDPETDFDVRAVMKNKIHTRRDAIFISGIKFTFDGATHTLQTRDAVDLINWTNVLAAAQALPAATTIKIRTESDASLDIPSGQIVTLISSGVAYRTAVMDASWAFKDSIDQAATEAEAFTAYESGIDTAWPDDSPINING